MGSRKGIQTKECLTFGHRVVSVCRVVCLLVRLPLLANIPTATVSFVLASGQIASHNGVGAAGLRPAAGLVHLR
jgi:hypothetical protein